MPISISSIGFSMPSVETLKQMSTSLIEEADVVLRGGAGALQKEQVPEVVSLLEVKGMTYERMLFEASKNFYLESAIVVEDATECAQYVLEVKNTGDLLSGLSANELHDLSKIFLALATSVNNISQDAFSKQEESGVGLEVDQVRNCLLTINEFTLAGSYLRDLAFRKQRIEISDAAVGVMVAASV